MQKALLLIDDKKDMRDEVRTVFEGRNWIVYAAPDLKAAEGVFSRVGRRICAVLSDARLSESDEGNIDGVIFAQSVKRVQPNLPVVGFSAHDQPPEVQSCFNAWHQKGGAQGGLDLPWVNTVETLSDEYLAQNRAREVEAVVTLKSRYGISEDDLRDLVSVRSLEALSEIGRQFEVSLPFPDEALAGPKRFIIIEPNNVPEGPEVRLSEEFGLAKPVPCFVSNAGGDLHIMELAFVPSYFGYGETLALAARSLVGNLRATFDMYSTRELEHDQAVDLVSLRNFVESLFRHP